MAPGVPSRGAALGWIWESPLCPSLRRCGLRRDARRHRDPSTHKGGAPPPPLVRVGLFGRPGEQGEVDQVAGRRLRTGARLWCSGVLLARELLGSLRPALKGRRVLELGCGLGLAGITLAHGTEAASVVLTDAEPGVVEAAQANLRRAGDEVGRKALVEVLDMRDLVAIRKLARTEEISAVVGADIVYEAAAVDVAARAIAAALFAGGRAWIVLPTKHRTGMSCDGFIKALTTNGLKVLNASALDHGGAHHIFSACEGDQEYVLFEAAVEDKPR